VILPYASTIFLSAFLLFLVQPIIAKQILPWFGGSSAVWTTALVFFPVDAAGGLRLRRPGQHALGVRRQTQLHISLLVLSLATLPILHRRIGNHAAMKNRYFESCCCSQ
jgi:hypothetical protein